MTTSPEPGVLAGSRDRESRELHETAEQFLYCANAASGYCWDTTDYDHCVTSNTKARAALYDQLRGETLTATLVQETIRRAVHATKSGVDRWKKGKRTTKPVFTSWSILYDKRSATFYRNTVSLSTVNGRVECDFELPADSPTPYEQGVLSEAYEFRASQLQYDHTTNEFYFHITTRKYDTDSDEGPRFRQIPSTTQSSASTSVFTRPPVLLAHQNPSGSEDVNSLTVASTGTFWQGDEYNHWCQEFEKRRRKLQQRGTQAARNVCFASASEKKRRVVY